jgi:predicted amidohydrolase
MRVGFYQFRPVFGKVNRNLHKVIVALKDVTADIIVLPELPFTGYYFQSRAEVEIMSEEIESSRIIDSLTYLCRERDFYIVTGFAEKELDRCFNSAVLIGPKGVIHTYRKLHLFNEEKIWFDPGDFPLQVQQVREAKIGIMICFDWIFPEVSRILTIQGADIICHPSNLVLDYCQSAMISRCIENNIFAITANRYGRDKHPQGELRFTGKSQIVAPKGKLLYRAHSQRECVYITEINVDVARDKNITPRNNIINDRRVKFYAKLCE